jgi:hypothetical protein
MTCDQVLKEAQRLRHEAKDPAAAERALQRLLARDLDPIERVRACTELGITQRSLGQLAESEQTLQEVVRERGMADKFGASAAYQLIWTTWSRDRGSALDVADALARDATDESSRLHARWAGAMLADELGDSVRARADYNALIAACADRPEYFGIVKDVRARLQKSR